MYSDNFDQDDGLSRLVIDILTNVSDFADSNEWQEFESMRSAAVEDACETFAKVLAKRFDEYLFDQADDHLLALLGEYLDAIEKICGIDDHRAYDFVRNSIFDNLKVDSDALLETAGGLGEISKSLYQSSLA